MKRRFLFPAILLAVLFQTGVLAKMITDRAAALRDGREVVLDTGFIDPRDIFRGHYVTLRLEISRFPKEDVTIVGKLTRNAPVYVALKKGEEGFWIPDAVHAEKPNDIDAPIIQGKMRYTSGKNVNISFPIDRYFAPYKRAQELENFRRDRKLGVVVSLDENGNSAIKGITIDGELIYDEPLY